MYKKIREREMVYQVIDSKLVYTTFEGKDSLIL